VAPRDPLVLSIGRSQGSPRWRQGKRNCAWAEHLPAHLHMCFTKAGTRIITNSVVGRLSAALWGMTIVCCLRVKQTTMSTKQSSQSRHSETRQALRSLDEQREEELILGLSMLRLLSRSHWFLLYIFPGRMDVVVIKIGILLVGSSVEIVSCCILQHSMTRFRYLVLP